MQQIIVIVRWVVSLLYAGLCLWASVAAIMGKIPPVWSHAIMALGAILLIAANFWKIHRKLNLVLASLALIHIAALFNGFYGGEIKISHHLFRLLISVIIYLLFYFSRGKY
ncbi:MAG: hypothetical protein LBQ86_04020 [Holophagales bacterium]|nr:hypothetical protein [Holophagales bacterium]